MHLTTDTPAQAPAIRLKPDCPHCAQAAAVQYDATCHGCQARRLAASQAAWRAARGIADTEIRDAILATFGQDGFREARLAVWGWMQRLGIVKA